MNLFSDCLDRLKPFLRVSKDQEVAAALGLSKTAFSERKKRGSFPDRELRALAQQRPELGIDVEYVLTGGTLTAHQRQAQERAQAFTQALNTTPAEKERLRSLLDAAGTTMAAGNASRAGTYEAIKDVLAACSDDTLRLALQLVVKLHRAERAEEIETRHLAGRASTPPPLGINTVHGQVVQGNQTNEKELHFTSHFGVTSTPRK